MDNYLETAGITVLYKSADISSANFIENANVWIPNLKELSGVTQNTNLIVDIGLANNELEYKDNGFRLRCNYMADQEYHLILEGAALLSKFLERELNESGRYSFHSSCVGYKNQAVIILGQSGSGKSVVSFACHLYDPDCKVISGERTVVEINRVISGTTGITLRHGSILYQLPNIGIEVQSTGNIWTNQSKIDLPNEIFMTPYEIKAIYLLHLSEFKLNVELMEGPDKFIQLYDNLVYFSDYFPTISVGQYKPVPNLSTIERQNARIAFVKHIIDIPLYSISGQINEVVPEIIKVVKG